MSVGLSSFVPKAHTPFQWFGQNPIEVLREKNNFLKRALLKRGVKYKGHSEEMSLLEAVFARGDETLSVLLEKAWSLGCRLDAWTEVFDFQRWKEAMDACQIDAVRFAEREYSPDSPLPWDNIQTGVTKDYLRREYLRAVSGQFTSDCRDRCHVCGLKCGSEGGPPEAVTTGMHSTDAKESAGQVSGSGKTDGIAVRLRMQYSKTGKMRFLSHLELVKAITRAMRRADLPISYSAGFHPAPKVSFGPALGVGVAGLKEYIDVELMSPFEIEVVLKDLNRTLPDGIKIGKIAALYGKKKSLDSFIVRYVYDFSSDKTISPETFLARDAIIVHREKADLDLKNFIEEIEILNDNSIRLTVHDEGAYKFRLDEFITEMFNDGRDEVNVTRVSMYGWDGGWAEPMEGDRIWAAKS